MTVNFETGAHTFKKGVNVLKLRQIVLTVTTFLDKERPIFQVLLAGILRIQSMEFTKYSSPCSIEMYGNEKFKNTNPWCISKLFLI